MDLNAPSIEGLPEEALIEIFSYFSPKLLKISSLVCKRWNNIVSQTPDLMKSFTLNLVPASSSKINEAVDLNRRFQSLKTNKLSPSICNLMESFNIRSLELTELVMDSTAFYGILARVERLEKLVMSNVRLADETEMKPCAARLNQLKTLSLKQVQGDVFRVIRTTTLKTYTEVIHDSSPLAPIVNMLSQQPSLEVLKLNGGKVDECFASDILLNAPFRLKHFSITGADLNQNSDDMKRFLANQSALEELLIQCNIQGSLLTFILLNMLRLKSLQVPTDFEDFAHLIGDVKPLPAVKRLKIVTALKNCDLAKKYFQLFPNLKAIDMKSIPSFIGPQTALLFIELNESQPGLEELHLPDICFPIKGLRPGLWKFANLKELHVAKIGNIHWNDTPFNEFIEDHSGLEKLSIGFIDNASFAKGTTVDSIKACKKLKQISIKSDSPMATRMLKKLSFDHRWQLVTKFPKTREEDESVEVKFNFPDDEALWREKCSVWDDDLVREFSSSENYGLNSFINMYK